MSLTTPVFETSKNADSISFVFSSTMKNVDDVCDQTTDFLVSIVEGIDDQLFSINIVLREGLTNAVRHGNKNDPEKLVKFLLSIDNNVLIKLKIEDQGDGFDWKIQQEIEPPEDQDHGRGIIIMDAYFTSYSYNEKGNILFLEKALFS